MIFIKGRKELFTMQKKNRYYLVGNAHLDPVWQWRWQEGSMEAKATIRSALDFSIRLSVGGRICAGDV